MGMKRNRDETDSLRRCTEAMLGGKLRILLPARFLSTKVELARRMNEWGMGYGTRTS